MNIIFLLKPKATVAFLYDTSTLRQGLEKMRVHRYTAIPVVGKDGRYVGTVSEGDFLWHMVANAEYAMNAQEDFSIKDIIRPAWNPPVKITATMDELLLRVMEQNFVPVVDDRDAFIGIITRKDVIRYFYEKDKKKASPERKSSLASVKIRE